jgi:hypothetical protein
MSHQETEVPRFAILRDVDPNLTRAEIDANAVQQIFNLAAVSVPRDVAWDDRISIESGLSWVRSYWHEGTRWGLCLYAARSKEELELYQVQCDVPFVEVREVRELASPQATEGENGRTRAADGGVLLGVEGRGEGRDVEGMPTPRKLLADWGEGTAGALEWVRTYLDEERQAEVSVYMAASREAADAVRVVLERAGVVVHEVTEIYPEDYVEG